jgi:UDP-2-acetamido-3-amino-2,3-dideoxy-glucuronate N-acetyltransferase
VCGHTIGRYAFIGAGAVVTIEVPDYALVLGNPGRVRGWMCECGVKLSSEPTPPVDVTCAACGVQYRRADGTLTPVRAGSGGRPSE